MNNNILQVSSITEDKDIKESAMSQTVRKQILSIVDTMENANQILIQLLADENIDDFINLLTECQNCAIEIGNKIEKNLWGKFRNHPCPGNLL